MSLEMIWLDIYIAAMTEFRDATRIVHTPLSFSKLILSSFIFQSNSLCEVAETSDKQKLLSKLNANLAKLCGEIPQLFERLTGEYPTGEEALHRTKKISDKVFSELADEEISHVCGVLAHYLEQLS